MAVDHPTVNPPLNCLQLVDILHRVQIPDRACELQRWPNQGFLVYACSLMVMESTFRFFPQNPSLAGLAGGVGNVRIPTKVVHESVTPRHLISLVNLRGWPWRWYWWWSGFHFARCLCHCGLRLVTSPLHWPTARCLDHCDLPPLVPAAPWPTARCLDHCYLPLVPAAPWPTARCLDSLVGICHSSPSLHWPTTRWLDHGNNCKAVCLDHWHCDLPVISPRCADQLQGVSTTMRACHSSPLR